MVARALATIASITSPSCIEEYGGVRLRAPPFAVHCEPNSSILTGSSEIGGIHASGAMPFFYWTACALAAQ
jgi:hypothetical protein